MHKESFIEHDDPLTIARFENSLLHQGSKLKADICKISSSVIVKMILSTRNQSVALSIGADVTLKQLAQVIRTWTFEKLIILVKNVKLFNFKYDVISLLYPYFQNFIIKNIAFLKTKCSHFSTIFKNSVFAREPWSSGYGRRLMFWRSWVRIQAPYTRLTFILIYLL